RRTSPSAPAADLDALVEGNTAFAIDLYQSLRADSKGNLFYSPYSISLALMMTWAGAESETSRQMADVLHVDLPEVRQHDAFNALDQALARRGERVPSDEGATGFQLSVANAVWGQQGFSFEDAYLNLLAEHYGAGMLLVDFAGAADGSRQLINAWVAEQTDDRIEDLLPPGVVNALTRLVLTNAIYFRASWLEPFDPAATEEGPFTTLDGVRVTIPMMHHSIRTGYAAGDGYQAVELPYAGQVSMIVIAPEAGQFRAFEDGLDGAVLRGIVNGLGDYRVALKMPRFEVSAEAGLSDVLKEMGMPLAFQAPGPDSGADFAGIDGRRDLFLQDVVHKAFVSVDEAGTEAAAATGVVAGVTSAPQPATLDVDRPFLFLIRDRETGAVLFLGRVVDPRG
ncbi:MAG: serpin family protein, partial [bacterium]|nr:serpin family protein [bacterium]